MNFTFSKRARTISMTLMVIGIALALVGLVGDRTEHHQHSWAALFINGFFFFGIALGALFFYALQYATETAWTVLLKRIYEGLYSYLPYGAAVIVICLAAGSLGMHHVWHWMDSSLYHPFMIGEGHDVKFVDEMTAGAVANPNYDSVVAGKSAFLNMPFFWIRAAAFIGTFLFGANWFRKQSLKMDHETGETLVRSHLLNYRRSAVFLVCFAVFSSVLAWDWIMSIDVHWFSTLFGWYVFAGMWVGGMIAAVVIALYLKSKGYLPQVNNSHIHDMGKWVFAISFLWTYLYFSQFMLYWYADIPEEVIYFQDRINYHPWLMWGMFFCNFALPMVLLISRDAKRNPKFLIGVGSIIFIGHWLDLCQMVLPGALGDPTPDGLGFHCIGLLEIGLFIAFLGLFINRVFTTLTKAPLTVVHHPYLEESIHHQI